MAAVGGQRNNQQIHWDYHHGETGSAARGLTSVVMMGLLGQPYPTPQTRITFPTLSDIS